MSRKLRAVTGGDVARIQGAINTLRRAKKTLRDAGAKKAAAYVARAMKSTEGALRHAERARV